MNGADDEPQILSVGEFIGRCKTLGPREAAELLAGEDATLAAEVMVDLLPSQARKILKELGDADRAHSRRGPARAGEPLGG